MTKREAIRQTQQENTLVTLGFSREQAEQLRRISMTLQKWYERECGTDSGCIERDETTDKPYWVYYGGEKPRRFAIPDRETGAIKRLSTIMKSVPALNTYLQTDPRGAALYILRPGDIPVGCTVDSCYSRGICVY